MKLNSKEKDYLFALLLYWLDDPKNILALTEKANALGGLGRYPEAIVYYDKVLDIDPKNVPALDNKGLSLYHLGNYT